MAIASKKLSTGVTALDILLAELWVGDNVVWCVDKNEFFWRFALPFLHSQRKAGLRPVYVGADQETARARVGFPMEVIEISDKKSPEELAAELRVQLDHHGNLGAYVFDDFLELTNDWTGADFVEVCRMVCPLVSHHGALAYYNVNLGALSQSEVARLKEIAQVVLALTQEDSEVTLNPIKVYGRYSRHMFTPHKVRPEGLIPEEEDSCKHLCSRLMEKNAELSSLRESQDSLERRFTHSETLLQSLIENTADTIFALDRGYIIRTWNPAAEATFGYTPSEIVGSNVEILVPEDLKKGGELERIRGALRERGHLPNYRTRRLHKDGHVIEVDMTLSLLKNRSGQIIGSSVILRDITEAMRMERHLQQAEKMAAIGQVASALGHEIGTPLNVISGNAELLKMELADSDPMAEELLAIVSETRRVAGLIDRLVRFARPGAPDLLALDINQVVVEVLELLKAKVKRSRVSLTTDFSSGALSVIGDGDQLKQVILNIGLNAIQAMPDGGRLEVTTERVDAESGPQVRILFRDSGKGIMPDDLPRIFEPFFSTKPRSEGTGLGLATSYQIVRAHGGWIDVQSEPGQGATFSIVLPYEAR